MLLGEIARLIRVKPNPCWRKQHYKSEGAGEAHLRALKRFPKVQNIERLHVYQCRYCGWYHVGRVAEGSDGG